MINVVPRFHKGSPPVAKTGMFVLYASGAYDLIGTSVFLRQEPIVKWSQLIEPHEMDWLQGMAISRELGVLK